MNIPLIREEGSVIAVEPWDTITTTNGSISIEELPAFPENQNPYVHDSYNMGQCFGPNVHVMFDTHSSQPMRYLIVVNTVTGERIRLNFNDPMTKAEKEQLDERVIDKND